MNFLFEKLNHHLLGTFPPSNILANNLIASSCRTCDKYLSINALVSPRRGEYKRWNCRSGLTVVGFPHFVDLVEPQTSDSMGTLDHLELQSDREQYLLMPS